jgi:hypothetical protein
MKAVLFYDDKDQDSSLGGSFLAEMAKSKWVISEKFPRMFTRSFKSDVTVADIKKAAKKDINNATFNAEWEKLPYVLVLTNEAVVMGVSK